MSEFSALTVSLNPALDITYHLADVVLEETLRVEQVYVRGGGKALNVARLLDRLGHRVTATGLIGGETGKAIRNDFANTGIEDAFIDVSSDSRRTVTLVDRGHALPTVLAEPGPPLAEADWTSFLDRFADLVSGVPVVVASGSLPPGAPIDGYEKLVGLAKRAGAEVILDTSGEALRVGLAGRPDIVKPNQNELAQMASARVRQAAVADLDWVARTTQVLRADHPDTAIVVSLGPEGLFASTPLGQWWARPAAKLTGNPTGAGDGVVAALAAGILTNNSWPDRLAEAVALSAAATDMPVAGDFDPLAFATYRRVAIVEDAATIAVIAHEGVAP